MSEIILAIIAFVAFSVITDFIEGLKKKRNQDEFPSEGPIETKPRVEVRPKKEKKRNGEIIIPPILDAPGKYEEQGAYTMSSSAKAPVHTLYKDARKGGPQEAAIVVNSNYDEAKLLRQPDIHWNVLLGAIAYTQILQPPKAYQYMATKSCRGEWNNNK